MKHTIRVERFLQNETMDSASRISPFSSSRFSGRSIAYHATALLILLLISSCPAFSQWQSVSSGTNDNIVDVCFPSDSVGLAVTDNGSILKTYDQGENWSVIATVPGEFTSISSVSVDTVFVGGNVLYRSSDGGTTWVLITTFSYTISDLLFFDAQSGVLIQPNFTTCTSSQGTVTITNYKALRTSDSGITWVTSFESLLAQSRFQKTDDSTAYITCSEYIQGLHCYEGIWNYRRKTSDKGATWDVFNLTGPTYPAFSIVNDTLGYYTGASTLWRLSNSTFTHVIHTQFSADQIVFINTIDGYALSGNAIYKTTTEGIVWDTDHPASADLSKLYNNHNEQMFAIGNNGTILRSSITESLYPDSIYRIYADTNHIAFDSIMVGGSRVEQVRIFNMGNMPLDINITSSDNFKVSLSTAGYANSIAFNLQPTRDTVVYVRFSPTDTLHYFNTLGISGTNVPSAQITMDGTGTNDLRGFLSGEATLCQDTIRVTGDFTINTDGRLTICPGTTLLFLGHYSFRVNGTLIAIGTPTDSINFIPSDTIVGWNGLRFDQPSAPDTSILRYCLLAYSKKTGWPNGSGGAIQFSEHSSVLIDSCTIRNNYSEYYGGGLFVDQNSSPVISNCNIHNNTSTAGGGLYISSQSAPVVQNNSIYNNTATSYDGGGIQCYASGEANIIQNLIFNNSAARYGGGIACRQGSDPNLINNTICNNLAAVDAGGLYCYGNGIYSLPVLLNDIFHSNTPNQIVSSTQPAPVANYCNIQGGYAGGVGNIDQDPGFINPTGSVGSMSQIGSYDWSLAQNSSCINSGGIAYNVLIPLLDIAGNPRIVQNRIDIGAYEYQATTSIDASLYSNSSISVFPNPFSETLSIVSEDKNEPLEFVLYDLSMRKLIQQSFIQNMTISTADFANGIYIYELKVNGRSVKSGKVIKQ